MDGACFGPTCAGLKTQAMATANKCSVPKAVNENTEGCKFVNFEEFVLRIRLMICRDGCSSWNWGLRELVLERLGS